MPKSIRSWGPSDPIPRAGLTPFPSLKKWEDPWEAGLDLVNLRGNAAEFDTIRQLSEDSPHGDPVPVVDPGQIDKLTASIELDDAKSAILRSDARLIAAWYELPKHQAHIFMGRSTLLDALEEAASKVRDLDEWLAPFVYETEELLQVLPAEVVGSRRDFDVVGLSQKSAEFSRLVDSILRFSRPPKRKPDSRRNVAIALAVWAVEDATGEAVTKKGQSRRGDSWHFTNRSGVFVRDLMKLLGWPDERVIVGAVEKLMREPRITDVSGGAFAYVTHKGAQRPAQFGMPIYIDDEFRTGPGTRLTLSYTDGGTVTLDQNVDPKFFQTAKCVVLNFFTGKLVVDASGKCVESQGSRVYQGSLVVYEANPNEGTLTVTVIRGHVETLIPSGIVINEGQTLTLRRGIPLGRPGPAKPSILIRAKSNVPMVIR